MAGSEGHAAVRIRSRGARRIHAGHPWVFRDDVARAGPVEHGAIVLVEGPGGEPLGWAFWSSRSKIALRHVAPAGPPPDGAFWTARVVGAIGARDRLVPARDATRLVFGESDGIPGFVADLYGRHLVVQVLTAATERIADVLIDAVAAARPIDSVLARNDAAVRSLEGLPREVRQRRGTTPARITIDENGVRLAVDPWRGQKTGAFLDQRDNRVGVAAYARGRVLDAFAYDGAFALHAARRASEVIVVDASRDALGRARENAALNGAANLRFVEANAFDELRARDRAGDRFDLVLLDPPAFAKSRADVAEARRGYKEINRRAMRLVAEGGVVVSSSCSYNFGEAEFLDVLAEAAADAGRRMHVLERRSQSADHPVRLGFPESRYLKCVVLGEAGWSG